MVDKPPPLVRRILSTLPADGTYVGNGRLRERTGIDADTDKELIGPLRTLGYVTVGRGRGGSLAITPAGLRYLTEDRTGKRSSER